MSKQAMELAISALETWIDDEFDDISGPYKLEKSKKAIAALKEAMSSLGCDKSTQYDAKPVAIGWLCDDGGSLYTFFKNEDEDEMADFIAETEPLTVVQLFRPVSPQPTKEK